MAKTGKKKKQGSFCKIQSWCAHKGGEKDIGKACDTDSFVALASWFVSTLTHRHAVGAWLYHQTREKQRE